MKRFDLSLAARSASRVPWAAVVVSTAHVFPADQGIAADAHDVCRDMQTSQERPCLACALLRVEPFVLSVSFTPHWLLLQLTQIEQDTLVQTDPRSSCSPAASNHHRKFQVGCAKEGRDRRLTSSTRANWAVQVLQRREGRPGKSIAKVDASVSSTLVEVEVLALGEDML